ncbi:MAG: hypothetical protein ACSLFQ_01550 [Thermoanaerobaculia bacterium]
MSDVKDFTLERFARGEGMEEIRAHWAAARADGFTTLSVEEYILSSAMASIPPSVDEFLEENEQVPEDPPADDARVIDFLTGRPR